MIAPPRVDPAAIACGPATAAVRALVEEFYAIDWFEPASDLEAAVLALHEHRARGHAFDPDAFAAPSAPDHAAGGWTEFVALCSRVRAGGFGWDWKYGGTKPISYAHARARGVDPNKPEPVVDGIHVRVGDNVFRVALAPSPPELGALAADAREAARFYLEYVGFDLGLAIDWQLAERSADLSTNPLAPLSAIYANGGYPFCLGRDHFVVFEFT